MYTRLGCFLALQNYGILSFSLNNNILFIYIRTQYLILTPVILYNYWL